MYYEVFSAVLEEPTADIRKGDDVILISREDGHVSLVSEECFLKTGGIDFMKEIKPRLSELSYRPSSNMPRIKDLKMIDVI